MFDLAIPCNCVKLSEPPPKLCEFLSRKTGDFLLMASSLLMEETIPPLYFRGLTALAWAITFKKQTA